MAEIVLRVRLIGGDQTDVTYGEPDTGEQEIIDRAIATLAADSGVLRCQHGDRLVALYGRGVAAVEVVVARSCDQGQAAGGVGQLDLT